MKKVCVLGAGMIGKAIAADLSGEYRVRVADIQPEALEDLRSRYDLGTMTVDLSDPENIRRAVEGCDLVVGALPGFMGYRTVETLIDCGKNVVDISFFAEDPFGLDEKARDRGLTVAVDCGVAPGLSNLILGHHDATMTVERFECLVGGLPRERRWPWEYKAPFSPVDVIEEYTRPARVVEHGRVVVKPALSETELVDFEGVGTLEAFNTDGLRTLLHTMKVPHMREKTLRYPRHTEYIRVLRDSGFFSREPIRLADNQVRPIDLTARLLFSQWRLDTGEEEFTVMRVVVEGRQSNMAKRYTYQLFDRFDPTTGTTSMARTTGYTCTAIARLILEGEFTRRGVCPPEYIGASNGALEKVFSALRARKVDLNVTEITL